MSDRRATAWYVLDMWLLLACSMGESEVLREPPLPQIDRDVLPAAPQTMSDPAASAKARPDWHPGTQYAPQAGPEIRVSAKPATGAAAPAPRKRPTRSSRLTSRMSQSASSCRVTSPRVASSTVLETSPNL